MKKHIINLLLLFSSLYAAEGPGRTFSRPPRPTPPPIVEAAPAQNRELPSVFPIPSQPDHRAVTLPFEENELINHMSRKRERDTRGLSDPAKRIRLDEINRTIRTRSGVHAFYEQFDVSPNTIREIGAAELEFLSSNLEPSRLRAVVACLLIADANMNRALDHLHEPEAPIYLMLENIYYDVAQRGQMGLDRGLAQRYFEDIVKAQDYPPEFETKVFEFIIRNVNRQDSIFDATLGRRLLELIIEKNDVKYKSRYLDAERENFQRKKLRSDALTELYTAASQGRLEFNIVSGRHFLENVLFNPELEPELRLFAAEKLFSAARRELLSFESGRHYLESTVSNPALEPYLRLLAEKELLIAASNQNLDFDASSGRVYLESALSNPRLASELKSFAEIKLLQAAHMNHLNFDNSSGGAYIESALCHRTEKVRAVAADYIISRIKSHYDRFGYMLENSIISLQSMVDSQNLPEKVQLRAAELLFEKSKKDGRAGSNYLGALAVIENTSFRNDSQQAALIQAMNHNNLMKSFIDNSTYPESIRLKALDCILVNDGRSIIDEIHGNFSYPDAIRLKALACKLNSDYLSTMPTGTNVTDFLQPVLDNTSYSDEIRLMAATLLFNAARLENFEFEEDSSEEGSDSENEGSEDDSELERKSSVTFLCDALNNTSYSDEIRCLALEKLCDAARNNNLGFDERTGGQFIESTLKNPSYPLAIRITAANNLFYAFRFEEFVHINDVQRWNYFVSIIINEQLHSEEFRISILKLIIDENFDGVDDDDNILQVKKEFLLNLYKNVTLTQKMRDLIWNELSGPNIGYMLTQQEYAYMCFINTLNG